MGGTPTKSMQAAVRSSVDCVNMPRALTGAIEDTVVQAAAELEAMLVPAASASLAAVLSETRIAVTASVADMASVHCGILESAFAPLPPWCIPSPDTAGEPMADATAASVRRGSTVDAWLPPLLSGDAGGISFFSSLADSASDGHRGAERMADAILGEWSRALPGGEEARDAVSAACGEWLESTRGRYDYDDLRETLVAATSGYVSQVAAFRDAAEAWVSLRDAAWAHEASGHDWFSEGYPRSEAGAFRDAMQAFGTVAGDDADALFVGMASYGQLAGNGGHLYIVADWHGNAEMTMLLSMHEPAPLGRSLNGVGRLLMRRFTHEAAHVLWRLYMTDSQRSAVSAAWAESVPTGDGMPSRYASSSAEEGFCEHVAGRIVAAWGSKYAVGRRKGISLSAASPPDKARALVELAIQESFSLTGNPGIDRACGCLIPWEPTEP